jgi:hypothetical protein
MSKPREKTIFEQRSKCPYCSKLIHTKVTRVTIKEAVKGETEIQGVIEKDPQSTLEKDFKASQTKTNKSVKRKGF